MKTQKQQIAELLQRAEEKIFSTGCPYLAIAEETGFITSFVVRKNPSNFGRLSMKKMLQTGGYNPEHSQFIFECLEIGLTCGETSKIFEADNFEHLRKVVKATYELKRQKF